MMEAVFVFAFLWVACGSVLIWLAAKKDMKTLEKFPSDWVDVTLLLAASPFWPLLLFARSRRK